MDLRILLDRCPYTVAECDRQLAALEAVKECLLHRRLWLAVQAGSCMAPTLAHPVPALRGSFLVKFWKKIATWACGRHVASV